MLNSFLLDIFVREIFSGIGPCESSRPEDSENVVLFGCGSLQRGVIAAQSQHILGLLAKRGVAKNIARGTTDPGY